MAGSWGCPHEIDDRCSKINNLTCDPGMKGCVLHGRFVFANDHKNERLRRKQAKGWTEDPGSDQEASQEAP
jgi:hypothetical protein